jgi:pseudouridine-5'-phosphate glycosidase
VIVAPGIEISSEIVAALKERRGVVALESTLISHGLPWPTNLETAIAAEKAVRDQGAVPATIAVLQGRPTIGLSDSELEFLAKGKGILKSSRRDLAIVIEQGRSAATTVAATSFLAFLMGIRVLATGGIGGVHRNAARYRDVSSDLLELSRTPVAVICAGAKSILDIPQTLEALETLGVPVIGFETSEFPAFLVRSSGQPVSARVDAPEQAAKICQTHWDFSGSGLILAQPVSADLGLDPVEFGMALDRAEKEAAEGGIFGPALSPFLLARLAELTDGKSVRANQSLIVENARLAAKIASLVWTSIS